MTDITPRRPLGFRVFVATIVLMVVAGLTLAPPSIAGPARWVFIRAAVALAEPLVMWIPGGLTERVLNTLLFVPLGATVALLLAARWWVVPILVGFVVSAAVELAQSSIPGRVPDLADVLWNTVGAAIGVALVAASRLMAGVVRASWRAVSGEASPAPAGRPRAGR